MQNAQETKKTILLRAKSYELWTMEQNTEVTNERKISVIRHANE